MFSTASAGVCLCCCRYWSLIILLQVLESDLGDRADNQYVDELFDEVENLSDSDIDMDTMSVHSTPKPKLTYLIQYCHCCSNCS